MVRVSGVVLVLLIQTVTADPADHALRLAGGPNNCSGRVEIYYNGSWGTVCDSLWDMDDAEVVCRELDCGWATAAPRAAHFGQGVGNIWMDLVNCGGAESSLSRCDCDHLEFGINSCDHRKDAGVYCSADRVRVVNGPNSCSGRVETYYNDTWGTVCDSLWDLSDAQVVCTQLGCGKALSAPGKARFGPGDGNIWLTHVRCAGTEPKLSHCSHMPIGLHICDHSDDAGVVCEAGYPVRLVGGPKSCSGRVEMKYGGSSASGDDGGWGTVCGDGWDLNDAQVVCTQSACGKALSAPAGAARFGQGSGSIWLDRVNCSGSESSLSQCRHAEIGKHDCVHADDAGVVCDDYAVRLAGGPNSCSGRVEIHYSNIWGTVCGEDWDLSDAQVVCRQLDCGWAASIPGSSSFLHGYIRNWLTDVSCSGNESRLSECRHAGIGKHKCYHTEEASVVCSEGMILTPGGIAGIVITVIIIILLAAILGFLYWRKKTQTGEITGTFQQGEEEVQGAPLTQDAGGGLTSVETVADKETQ